MCCARSEDVFAEDDDSGMAKRLFVRFLNKNNNVEIFEDKDLNSAIAGNETFIGFAKRALAAPGTKGTNAKKTRIHQALKNANWDIGKVSLLADLGVPAFKKGIPVIFQTKDHANGLRVMISGIQHVFIYVEKYQYNGCKQQYYIKLKFVLYDVFGMDDGDLKEYGASKAGMFVPSAYEGFTAWWQLQHQFNYPPLITRAEVFKEFTISTSQP